MLVWLPRKGVLIRIAVLYSEAQMSAFLGESSGSLAEKAEEARVAGKLEWALRLSDGALVLNPDDGDAFETKKAAMLALAEGTMNSQPRNMLLSDYLLMSEQAKINYEWGNPQEVFKRIDDNAVPLMPMDTLQRIQAVNLNASKSVETDTVVGLQLTDVKKDDPQGAKSL